MNGEFPTLRVGSRPCRCPEPFHDAQLVVVMGGPGAGKTAVLELAAHTLSLPSCCRSLELASI